VRALGIVDWTGLDKTGQTIAGVLPLFDITTSEWRSIHADKEFPALGRAFWFRATATETELLYFRAEDNVGGKEYEFKVTEPHVAIEVRDLRELGTPEIVRRALSAGLKWPALVAGRALLWCADDLVVGPVKLVPSNNNLITFEHPQRHEIPCYSKNDIDLREVPDPRYKRFVLAETSPLVANSYVDWDTDKLVVRRAITWAAERAKEKEKEIALTKRQIEEAASYLTNSGANPKLKLEYYRLQRTLEMIAGVQRANEVTNSAIEALQKHPVISKELEELRERVTTTVTEDIRKALKKEHEALAQTQLDREQLASEVETAQSQLENIRIRIDDAVRDIEVEVDRRIAEVLEKPATLLAESAILRTVLNEPKGRITQSNDPQSDIKKRPSIAWPRSQNVITEFKDFKKLLLRSSKATQVPLKVFWRIHAAISSRLLPVLAGPQSIKALEGYARVACGARVFRIHASPSFFEVSDLFGKFDSVRGQFLPHPAGLIDVLETARQSSGQALVIIEGANRAPTESYLLPLLQAVQSNSTLQLFHPTVAAPSDPYYDMCEINWPTNLLLAMTVVEGATTLPISPDIWINAVLVETDGDSAGISPYPEVSEVNLDEEMTGLPDQQTGISDALLESLPAYVPFRNTSERYLSALSYFESDLHNLETAFIESLLLPLIVSLSSDEECDKALNHLIEAASTSASDPLELEPLAQRIRRRLS
jgi:hypothetical protein